jgi:hypothetical protein
MPIVRKWKDVWSKESCPGRGCYFERVLSRLSMGGNVDSLLFLLSTDLDQERNPSDLFRVLFAYELSYPFGSHVSLLEGAQKKLSLRDRP